MTPEERAAAIGAALGSKTITFSHLGVTFRVSGAAITGNAISLLISAWTGAGGNRVNLPVGDGQFVFVNPPLAVPDGGFDVDGRPTYARSDLAAAKQMVYDAVTGYALRHGWTP